MGKRIGHCLLAALLLLMAGLSTVTAAPVADIEAQQTDQLVTIAGHTADDDPDRVPLIVFDEAGQAIFFQDVIGKGSSFQLQFIPPETAEEGTATAVLYSGLAVSTDFRLTNTAEEIREKISVTFSITGYQGEEIVPKEKWSIKKGSSVFSLLEYVAEETGIEYEIVDEDGDGEDVYIKSIDGLAEFDKGAGSGWIYKVNGEGPQAPVDRYELDDGDHVELIYTSDYGETEIGGNAGSGSANLAKSDLVTVDKAFGRLTFADSNKQIESVIRSLLFDLASEGATEQQKYVADVGRFLQAAYERAATISVSAEEDSDQPKQVEIRARAVKERIAQQKELRPIMEEILASSALYKHFLDQLHPAFAVALPDRGDRDSYQISIETEAWQTLAEENMQVAITRGDFRMGLLPDRAHADTIPDTNTFIGFYDDQEQTAMVDTIQQQGKDSVYPLTRAYRILSSPEGFLRYRLQLPLTSASGPDEWPTLYFKQDKQANWAAAPDYVTLSGQWGHTVTDGSGEMMLLASPHSYQDVLAAPAQLSWAKEPILALTAVGIATGETPERYGMQTKVSKTEFTRMLSRLSGPALTGQTESDPKELSRMEAAVLLAQAAGMKAANQVSPYSDLGGVTPDAAAAISFCAEKGWLHGRSAGRFDPFGGVTRAEAAVIIYRFWQDASKSEEVGR